MPCTPRLRKLGNGSCGEEESQGNELAILFGKIGIITIEVDDKDSKRAAELANAYVDELYKLTKVLAVTEASQRRLFFERQLAQAKDNLAKAEASAKQSLETGGLVQVEGQGLAVIRTARVGWKRCALTCGSNRLSQA